jgi:subtilase-type serine protease
LTPLRPFLGVCLVLGAAACASGGAHRNGEPATSAPVAATPAVAPEPVYRAGVVREVVVDPLYRQGLARVPGGWVFSFNDGLFRTDDALHQTLARSPAIPAVWKARGYDHIGDIDVVRGVLYAPLEQPRYALGHQAMLMYDAATLTYRGGVVLPQHQNSFVTVDAARRIAYTMDEFGGDSLLRYDIADGWRALDPLRLSTRINRVQGADLSNGAIWCSTDDKRKGVYRVDLHTGDVQLVGSIGHLKGEGEGIDATATGGANLRVLSIDPKVVPVRLVELRAVAANSG